MSVAETNFRQMSFLAVIATGWKPWLDQEELSLLFTQLILPLDDNDAVSDFLSILDRIEPGNIEGWYGAWKDHAAARKAKADAAFADRRFQIAQASWLQASVYYKVAGIFLADDDQRKSSLVVAIENCSRLYLESMTPSGEIIEFVCDDCLFVRGYFLRAPHAPQQSAAVVCFGGPDETRDELLAKMPRYALADGLSVLIVDLPKRRDRRVEVPIGACVDYLIARGDIDEDRVAIFGNNLGAIDASRAVSLDPRFAAAVCDGGVWDQNRGPRLLDWASDGSGRSPDQQNRRASRYALAHRIACPFLVTSGEYDFLDTHDVAALYAHCKELGAPMELKLFSVEESGAPRRKFVFDWIAAKLASDASVVRAGSSEVRESRQM